MAQASFAPGQVLDGRYEVVRPLGAGGMGEVFVARRVALGDLVAIKRLRPAQDTPENRARFLGEARAAAHIQHPNVVRVFDFGDQPGATPYMVMEYLDGPTLADELAVRRALSAGDALALFAPICAAIEAGHRRRVIHRDLKPSNVILARADDGTRVVKVLDFGLAVLTGGAAPQRLTSPGTIVGTCSYMAPEQVAGMPAMPASDVFTLGVILYEMVTGEVPFEAETQMATLFRISQGRFRPPRELVPELPRALDDAIAAALQVDPAKRPASPEQLLALAGGSALRTPGPGRPISQPGIVIAPHATTGSEPTAVVALDAKVATPRSGSRRIAAPTPRLDVVIGRAQELARLEEEQREALGGRGRIVVVAGDDGEGRTRLAEAFARKVSGAGAYVLTARFFDGAQGPPRDAFARMLGGSTGSSTDLDEHRRIAAAGASAITAAIAARASGRALVIVLDDLHHAAADDLAIVDHLFQQLPGVLVIATASAALLRKGADAGPAGRWLAGHLQRRSAVTLKLRPFGLAEVRAWLEAAFGVVHVRPRDLRRLEAAAGGNPLFLAELVRHLLAADAPVGGAAPIRRRDDEWIVEVPDELEAPPPVAALVDARVAGLDPDLVGVLELAAVAGDEVQFEPLQAASGLPEDVLDRLLERACAEGLLRKAHDYRFASGLLRAALYARMSPRARRRAHRKLLDVLLAHPSAETAAARAMHHAALDELPAALAAAVAALGGALDRGDMDGAETALRSARSAAQRLDAAGQPPTDVERARVDLLGGAVAVRVGRMGEARALLSRGLETARRAGDAALELDLRTELAHCQVALGDHGAAITGASDVIHAAKQRGDRLRAARAAAVLSLALLRRGRHDEAQQAAEAILADAELPAALRAFAYRNRAWARNLRGDFAAGDEDASRALDLARGAGDPYVTWLALNARAAIASHAGDPERGAALHQEALDLARAASLRRCEAIALANLGEESWNTGDAGRALDCFREALSIFVDIEDRACEGDCRVNVGRALLAAGDRTGAVAMLERGRELCDATGRAEYAALGQLHLGEARLAGGDAAAARTLASDARQRLDAIHSPQLWRAELLLAQAALLDADRDRARYHGRRAAEHVDAQRAHLAPGSTAGFDRMTRAVRDFLSSL